MPDASTPNIPAALIAAMRPYQWSKNLFVLAPLVFGRKLMEAPALLNALTAAAIFCLASSGMYLLNDLIDASSDRLHPAKRLRPIAYGALPARIAGAAAGLLLAASFLLAWKLGQAFLIVLAGYVILILAYSLGLKRIIILECMIIASGFALRLVGGAAAVPTFASHWLILCGFLLALYLAFAKRRTELISLGDAASDHRHVLGGYTDSYLEQINNTILGITIVCYTLYTVAPETVERFGTDLLIYGVPFVIYGLLRYKLIVQRAPGGDDPGRLLLRDKPLLLAVSLWGLYNAAVIYRDRLFG